MFKRKKPIMIKLNNPEKLSEKELKELEVERRYLAMSLTGNIPLIKVKELSIWKSQNVYIVWQENLKTTLLLIEASDILGLDVAVARLLCLVKIHKWHSKEKSDFSKLELYKLNRKIRGKNDQGLAYKDFSVYSIDTSWTTFDKAWKEFDWLNA